MKTLAVRLDDDTMDLLGVVSQLEGTSLVDQIRTAIQVHLERKVAEGDLASRAEALIDAIDQEANAKKAAIGGLVGKASKPGAAPKGSSRSRSSAKPPEGQAELIDSAPPAKPSRGRQR